MNRFSSAGIPSSSHPAIAVSMVAAGLISSLLGLLALILNFQKTLDARADHIQSTIEELAQLPKGEYLKPALLGYDTLGADILWLRTLQVLGKKRNSQEEYEWMYHAIDVITTLDPQYAYPYYVGGVVLTNIGNRVDLSNRILEKGHQNNPAEWNLLFLLGYNHYFILGDAKKGAGYIGLAARTSGAPDFLSGLATRMYAEAGNPDVALQFIEALWKENPDLAMREKLEVRAKEVMIERDLIIIEKAVKRFREKYARLPASLPDLVGAGLLPRLPDEPFGGTYRIDPQTGSVFSSTHPKRLKVFRLDKEQGV
jgi:hypothetical protein